jgi:hypothetical protein
MSQSGVVCAVNKAEKGAKEKNYQLVVLLTNLQMDVPILPLSLIPAARASA